MIQTWKVHFGIGNGKGKVVGGKKCGLKNLGGGRSGCSREGVAGKGWQRENQKYKGCPDLGIFKPFQRKDQKRVTKVNVHRGWGGFKLL